MGQHEANVHVAALDIRKYVNQGERNAETGKRRQSSSCDQCRQGKRACDAIRTVLISDTALSDGNNENLIQSGNGLHNAQCSYCHKTGKQCTFKWLASVRRRRRQGRCQERSLRKISRKEDQTPSTNGTMDEDALLPTKEHSSHSSGLDIDGQDMSQDVANTAIIGNTESDPLTLAGLNTWDVLCQSDIQSSITESLMKVYQDSMENALDCWLTESNCPYTPKNQLTRRMDANGSSAYRVLHRICKLDKDMVNLPLCRYNAVEEKRASRALRLTMLSFATQWAQDGPRESSPYLIDLPKTHQVRRPRSDPGCDGSFGRSMQETLWHQARSALLEAEGVVSSRVVFAFIIFSLTQKPLEPVSDDEALRKSINHVVELDGPPVFLESAMRQLSKMRRMLQRAFSYQASARRKTIGSAPPPLDQESQHTFDLLFWLGVMFDTLSAAMHDRAVVVPDEDCEQTLVGLFDDALDLDGWNSHPDVDGCRTQSPGLWEQRLLSTDLENQPRTWPCDLSVAKKLLREAAPVKVLLYRKVAHLQTLISRNAPSSKVEDGIDDGLLVYSYWQSHYQPFIVSCTQYHESLPPQLQSWYGILAGHWHLAAMIFADVVEQIDGSQLSCATKRLARQRSSFVFSWRFEHACAVSDLAEVALSEENPSFGRTTAFHGAINKSALLSEPWTAVLTRSFSKAADFLLDNSLMESGCDDEQDIQHRAQRCIEALRLLGKKSDVAMLLAETLKQRFVEIREFCCSDV